MSRRYDSPAIDPLWREARDKARFIATISYVGYWGGTRRVKKFRQRLEREWFFGAFLSEVTK